MSKELIKIINVELAALQSVIDCPDAGLFNISSTMDVLRDCKGAIIRQRDDTHGFKNFHRSLCDRFGYAHDQIDWRRDQVSLIEHIASLTQQQEAEPVAYEARIKYSFGWGGWQPCSRENYQEFSVPGACAGMYPVEARALYLHPPAAQPQVPHIWVLTESYNDYNQHGYYFVAAWTNKPTLQQIAKVCGYTLEGAEHVLAGGGREGLEEHWYELMEYEQLPAAKEEGKNV